jgi:TPR repeat protein
VAENKNYSLVVRPTGTVEKAAPGAKRILSGMVADTLALVPSVDAETLYQKACAYEALKKRDLAEIIRLFRMAAERGHAEASWLLGLANMSGDWGQHDNKQAVYWIRKAAERGHARAQFMFGVCYFKGQRVPPDLPEAYMWLKLAAEQNHNFAARLASLSSTMTSDQLQEGERRCHEFKAKYHGPPKT